MRKRDQNRAVILILISGFVIYNAIIYTQPSSSGALLMADDAVAGEVLWQKHNCASCHQLYGLGGYLGPDLTNAVSNPAKGEEFVKAYFNSGAGAMPVFNFNEEEKENLLTFLKHVDKTGYYPVKDATFHSDGWVSIEYK